MRQTRSSPFLYRNFRLLSKVSKSLREKYTPEGQFLMVALVLTAVVGVDTTRSVTYQLFSLILGVFLVSAMIAFGYRGRFKAKRELPRMATVGETIEYNPTLSHLSDQAVDALDVIEDFGCELPSFELFSRSRFPEENRLNAVDRRIGYQRWTWVIRRFKGAKLDWQSIETIPAGKEIVLRCTLTPIRRGYIHLKGVTVGKRDPLGLVRKLIFVECRDSLLVLPKRYPIAHIPLSGGRCYQPGGVTLASNVGDSNEFHALREYVAGDPIKNIHWRSWAKLGKPVVKEYKQEYFVRHGLIFDNFTNDVDDILLDEAVSVAASIASEVLFGEVLLDVLFVGADAYCFTAGRGLGSAEQLLSVLACIEFCHDKPFETLEASALEHAHQFSSSICVFLAWDQARQRLVKGLRAMGIDVLVLIVRAKQDTQPLDPGVMKDVPQLFKSLQVGKLAEGLLQL